MSESKKLQLQKVKGLLPRMDRVLNSLVDIVKHSAKPNSFFIQETENKHVLWAAIRKEGSLEMQAITYIMSDELERFQMEPVREIASRGIVFDTSHLRLPLSMLSA